MRLVRDLLYQVSPFDATLVGAAVVILVDLLLTTSRSHHTRSQSPRCVRSRASTRARGQRVVLVENKRSSEHSFNLGEPFQQPTGRRLNWARIPSIRCSARRASRRARRRGPTLKSETALQPLSPSHRERVSARDGVTAGQTTCTATQPARGRSLMCSAGRWPDRFVLHATQVRRWKPRR